MNEYTYSVIVDKEIVAHEMTLKNALILAKALFEEYFNEEHISVTIQRDTSDKCTISDEEFVCEGRDVY